MGRSLQSRSSWEPFVHIPHIKDVKTAAQQLGKVLKLKPSELTRRLVDGGNFVLIKRKVNDKDIGAVEKLSLKGFTLSVNITGFTLTGSWRRTLSVLPMLTTQAPTV